MSDPHILLEGVCSSGFNTKAQRLSHTKGLQRLPVRSEMSEESLIVMEMRRMAPIVRFPLFMFCLPCMPACLPASLSVSQPASLSVCLSVCVSNFQSVSLSVCQPVCLPAQDWRASVYEKAQRYHPEQRVETKIHTVFSGNKGAVYNTILRRS